MILDVAKAMIEGKLPQAPVAKLIGFELVAIEPGSAVIELHGDRLCVESE